MTKLMVRYLGQEISQDFQDSRTAAQYAADQLVLSVRELFELEDTGRLETFDGIQAVIMEGENE
jgi:hypothetical protein